MNLADAQRITIGGKTVETISIGGMTAWKAGVPSGYTILRYLQSSGTQYIDTEYGFYPTDEMSAKAAFTVIEAADKYIVAPKVWNTSKSNRFALGGYYTYNAFAFGYGANPTNNTSFLPATAVDTLVHTYVYKDYEFSMPDIGSSMDVTDIPFVSETANLRLFYGYNRPTKCRMYSYTHVKNNVEVCNMIPALRVSDSKPGMYDTVSKQFFVNAGTGEFTYA